MRACSVVHALLLHNSATQQQSLHTPSAQADTMQDTSQRRQANQCSSTLLCYAHAAARVQSKHPHTMQANMDSTRMPPEGCKG